MSTKADHAANEPKPIAGDKSAIERALNDIQEKVNGLQNGHPELDLGALQASVTAAKVTLTGSPVAAAPTAKAETGPHPAKS